MITGLLERRRWSCWNCFDRQVATAYADRTRTGRGSGRKSVQLRSDSQSEPVLSVLSIFSRLSGNKSWGD